MHLNFRSLYTVYCAGKYLCVLASQECYVPYFSCSWFCYLDCADLKEMVCLLIVCAVPCSYYDKLNGSENSAKTRLNDINAH